MRCDRSLRTVLILGVSIFCIFLSVAMGVAQEAVNAKIRAWIEQGRFEQAEKELRSLLNRNPKDIESYHLLSEILRRQNRLDEAIDTEKRIIQLNPKDVEAHFWLGTYYRWKGEAEKAIDEYTRVLSLEPRHVEARLGRARVLLYQDKLESAEQDLKKVLQAIPKHPEASELLVDRYFRSGEYELAESHVRSFYSGNELHRQLGRIAAHRQQIRKAIREYVMVIRESPTDIEAHRALGDLYRQRGDLPSAIAHYERVASLEPDDSDALFWLGTFYYWQGRFLEAEEAFQGLLKIDPNHTEARIGLCHIRKSQGKVEACESLLKTVMDRYPQDAEAVILKGSILEEQGYYSEAAQLYQSILERDPSDQDAALGYYRVLGELKPVIDLEYGISDTEAREGRGDPNITVSTVEYFSDRISGKIRYRIQPDLSLHISGGKAREKVEVLSGNFVVYDFDSLTGLLGADYQVHPRWNLLAEMGATGYTSNQPGSIQDKAFFRYLAKVSYRRPMLLTNLSLSRSPFLGRGFSSDTSFGIFTENRIAAHHERPLSLWLRWDLDYAFSYYSDENTTHFAATGLGYSYKGHVLSLRYAFAPVQGRFLLTGEDKRLDFINTYTLAMTYDGPVIPDWAFAGEARYTLYEGDNHEAFGKATLTYNPYYLPLIYAGGAFTLDIFSRDALEYNNLDIYYTTLFLEFRKSLSPHWLYQLRYAHSFITDEGTAGYDSDEVTGHLEYTLSNLIRSGIQGRYLTNSVEEAAYNFIAYLRLLL